MVNTSFLRSINAVNAVKAVKKQGRKSAAFHEAVKDVRNIDDAAMNQFRRLIDKFKNSEQSILDLQLQYNDTVKAFVRSHVQKVYIRSSEFVQQKHGIPYYLTDEDLNQIKLITENTVTKFWNSVQRARDKMQPKTPIRGAAGDDDFLSNALSSFLATQAVNAAVLATNHFILNTIAAQQQEPVDERYVYRTVGDSSVCPICEPHDGEIMSDGIGNMLVPPLHDSCRCWLEPESIEFSLEFSIEA